MTDPGGRFRVLNSWAMWRTIPRFLRAIADVLATAPNLVGEWLPR